MSPLEGKRLTARVIGPCEGASGATRRAVPMRMEIYDNNPANRVITCDRLNKETNRCLDILPPSLQEFCVFLAQTEKPQKQKEQQKRPDQLAFITTRGSTVLDKRNKTVKFGEEKPIRLTKSELSLLEGLLENLGTALTREELGSMLGMTEAPPESKIVNIHIQHLRRKIGDNERTFVETIPGIGYLIDRPPEE